MLLSSFELRDGLGAARLCYYLGAFFVGALILRPSEALTISDYFFAAAFASAVLSFVVRRVQVQCTVHGGVFWGTYLFAFGAIVSTFGSPEPLQSLAVTVRFISLAMIWIWLSAIVLRRPAHVWIAATCWVISISLSGLAAIAQLMWGDVIPNTSPAWGRMTGFAQHVNDLGAMSAVALPIALCIVLVAPGRVLRLAILPAVLLIVAGLVLSGSVGGLLAALAGLVIFLIWIGPSRKLLAIVGLAAAATFLLVHLQVLYDSPSPLDRLTAVREPGGTVDTRVDIYESVLPRIIRNPVIGVGPGVGLDDLAETASVHNMFLGIWYETGVVGLLGLLVVIGVIYLGAIGGRARAGHPAEAVLYVALAAAFAAYLCYGLGAPALYARYGWMPAALIMALHAQQLGASPIGTSSPGASELS